MKAITEKNTTKLMTAEEFADWVDRPENENKYFELVRGEVIELPLPMKRHGTICMNTGSMLWVYTRQRGKGYVTANDAGVILERDPDTVRGPDIALYEDAQTFAELHPKYGEIPPRLAVEVLSPNDRADRMMRKVSDYLRSGVDMVWVIDPEARTVTVHRPGKGQRVYEEHEELDGEDVLPGFRCRVADIFLLPGEQPAPKPKPRRKRRK